MPNVHSKEYWLESFILESIEWFGSKKQIASQWISQNKSKTFVMSSTIAAVLFLTMKSVTSTPKSYQKRNPQSRQQGTQSQVTDELNQKPRIDKALFQRLFKLIRILIPSWKSVEAVIALLLSTTIIGQSFLSRYVIEVSGELMKFLILREKLDFAKVLLYLTALQFGNSLLSPLITFFTETLSNLFRKNMTHHIHEKYFKDIMYYRLKNLDKRIQNPDQRITQDTEIMCQKISNLFVDVISPLTDVIIYSAALIQMAGVGGPLSILGYVLLSFVALSLVTPNFTRMSQEIQNREGKFRYMHARTQINGESIAFYQGDRKEKENVERSFEDLTSYTTRVISKNFVFGIVNDYFTKYAVYTAACGIGGFPVFFGKMRNMEKTELFGHLRNLFMIIAYDFVSVGKLIELFRSLLKLSGYTIRVNTLLEVMNDLERIKKTDTSVKGKFKNSSDITFSDVSIITPGKVLLAKHLNFEIEYGKNTAISGPNGAGKSSLFRVLGELWPLYKGQIGKPLGKGLCSEIFYLPQKCYNVIGSLRDQIIYPDQSPKRSDTELQQLLELFGIGRLSREGFDRQQDWDKLSRGEQQRLAMVRLFYHKPRFAILDECTSVLNRDAEINLYNQCKNYGITCITISHRPALDAFHHQRMVLDGEGGWKIEQILHDTYDEEMGCKGKIIDTYKLTESDTSESEM